MNYDVHKYETVFFDSLFGLLQNSHLTKKIASVTLLTLPLSSIQELENERIILSSDISDESLKSATEWLL